MEEFLSRCHYQAVRLGVGEVVVNAPESGLTSCQLSGADSAFPHIGLGPCEIVLHLAPLLPLLVPRQGQYDSLEDYGALDKRMCAAEKRFKRGDRVFYLSIPPNIFTTVAASASSAASSK